MASSGDITTAFSNAGAGSPSDTQMSFYSNPSWSDAGSVEGDVRAGGMGQSKIPSISMNDIGGSAVDFNKNTVQPVLDSAFNSYQNAVNTMPRALDMYNTLEQKAGIPTLRTTANTLQGQIGNLEDAIRNVEPNINATTQNSLVTEGQRNKMVTDQRYPLQNTLTPLATALSRTESSIQNQEQGINQQVGYATQDNQTLLDPYKQKIQLASDQAARLMTGFTADRQTQLSILQGKIAQQQALTQQEWQQAADLSKMKLQFDETSKQNAAATQIVESNGHQLLINSQTGKVVADLGPKAAGTGGTNGTLTPPSSSSNSGWEIAGPPTPTNTSSSYYSPQDLQNLTGSGQSNIPPVPANPNAPSWLNSNSYLNSVPAGGINLNTSGSQRNY